MIRTALYDPEKSIFNFKIQYKNGDIIDLHEKNLWVESFRISSPPPDHSTESVEGQHGEIYLGTVLKGRKINASISIEAMDFIDFDLLRDEIFRIFTPLEEFYIIRDLQPGKRMRVVVDGGFDIDYTTLEDGKFEISFMIYSVLLESIGTTLDMFTFDSELWQIGQGLISEDVQYVHKTASFRLYNAGDVEIDPRKLPLVIRIRGATNNLKITNRTTGDVFRLNISTLSRDTVELNRIRVMKNGNSIFTNTNRKVISIASGWNDFIVSGITGAFQIEFDFRFYYL
ncbi:phage tail family protein [Bacillus mobilis]|uniref:phage tail family protein n=1 Tax=Bacillus mobilis TaxID=2026190 RepID=UPI003CEB1D62